MTRILLNIIFAFSCIAWARGAVQAQQAEVSGNSAVIKYDDYSIGRKHSTSIRFSISPRTALDQLAFNLGLNGAAVAIESIRQGDNNVWVTDNEQLFARNVAGTALVKTDSSGSTIRFAREVNSGAELFITVYVTAGARTGVATDSTRAPLLSIDVVYNSAVLETIPIPLQLKAD